MPTKRPRYTVTASDELSHALDEAARWWPAERDAPARLLLHLAMVGFEAMQRERQALEAADLTVVDQVAGALTGAYSDGYLDDLREDWPA
jgi:hypothetical protein